MQQVIYQKTCWELVWLKSLLFLKSRFFWCNFLWQKKKTHGNGIEGKVLPAGIKQNGLSYAFSSALCLSHSLTLSIDIDIKLMWHLMEKETTELLLMQISVVCSHSGKLNLFYFSWTQPVVITIAVFEEEIKP